MTSRAQFDKRLLQVLSFECVDNSPVKFDACVLQHGVDCSAVRREVVTVQVQLARCPGKFLAIRSIRHVLRVTATHFIILFNIISLI